MQEVPPTHSTFIAGGTFLFLFPGGGRGLQNPTVFVKTLEYQFDPCAFLNHRWYFPAQFIKVPLIMVRARVRVRVRVVLDGLRTGVSPLNCWYNIIPGLHVVPEVLKSASEVAHGVRMERVVLQSRLVLFHGPNNSKLNGTLNHTVDSFTITT